MRTIGLIACCKRKLETPCAAQDLYVSHLFKLARRYVEETCNGWAILSAEHGLVMPDQILSPYNTTLNEMPAWRRATWAGLTGAAIRDRFPQSTFVVIAGKHYREAVRNLPHTVPFHGLGIGLMVHALQHFEDQRKKTPRISKGVL
jgi:hypothetical protein